MRALFVIAFALPGCLTQHTSYVQGRLFVQVPACREGTVPAKAAGRGDLTVKVECPAATPADRPVSVTLQTRADGRFGSSELGLLKVDCEVLVEGRGIRARRFRVGDFCVNGGGAFDVPNTCSSVDLAAVVYAGGAQ